MPRGSDLRGRALLLDQNRPSAPSRRKSWGTRAGVRLATLDNFELIARPSRAGDASFKCQPYQLSLVSDLPTKVVTGDGKSGFDSGEGA